jgi:hypothetical protein
MNVARPLASTRQRFLNVSIEQAALELRKPIVGGADR